MRMPPPKPGTPVRPMTPPKPKGSMGPKVTPTKPVGPKTAPVKTQTGSIASVLKSAPKVVGGKGAKDDMPIPRGAMAKPSMAQRGGAKGMAYGGMAKKGKK